MEYRRLGRTGLRVSRIGLGGFPFGGVNRAAGWDLAEMPRLTAGVYRAEDEEAGRA